MNQFQSFKGSDQLKTFAFLSISDDWVFSTDLTP